MANSEISHLQMGQQWTQKYMDLAILGENEFKSEFFYFCLIQSNACERLLLARGSDQKVRAIAPVSLSDRIRARNTEYV